MRTKIKILTILGTCIISLGTISPILGLSTIYADNPTSSTQITDAGPDQNLKPLIEKGYLNFNKETNTVTITEKYKQEVLANTDTKNYTVTFTDNSVSITPKISTRSFTGVTKIVYTSKGYDVYLDSTTANKVASGVGVGAAASTLIPDPTLSKAFAVTLGAAAGLIGYNNAAGRGVIIAFIGQFPNGVPHWVTSQ